MISPLPQKLLKFVERIWFRANRLSTAFLDNTKNTRQLINFVLADVNMAFNAINWTTFEVSVRIQHPTGVDYKINRYRFKNRCSHEFIGVKLSRRFMINFIWSEIVMTKNARFT